MNEREMLSLLDDVLNGSSDLLADELVALHWLLDARLDLLAACKAALPLIEQAVELIEDLDEDDREAALACASQLRAAVERAGAGR